MKLNLPLSSHLSLPLAVVCHDAGAANIIVTWIKEGLFDVAAVKDNKIKEGACIHAYMAGPALGIWKRALPERILCSSVEEALDGAGVLLSGTGWASDVEHRARCLAKEKALFSVAVLDHWVNYNDRFVYENTCVYPDEFWVTDEHAYRLAEEAFSGAIVRQKPNLYLPSQLANITPITKVENTEPPELLYICEPMRNDWGRGRLGEFQALDFFAACLSTMDLPAKMIIRLRPHPSDEPGKYAHWIAQYPELGCMIDTSAEISTSISRARWVVGCESFALVLALAADRVVYCSLPAWAPECRLPHQQLIHLRNLPAERTVKRI